jgi:hypothetical protein
MFAQEGKQQLLRERSAAVAALLAGGAAVCLCDVRGTGETGVPGDDRGRTGEAADVAQTEFMLGGTVLGARLRDLCAVLRYLRSRDALDGSRVALWGESLAGPNAPDRRLDVPLDAGKLPDYAEPLGGLLAMLGMLFEQDIRAAYAHGGLTDFASCLQSPFCYIPADVVVPGAIPVGDVAGIKQAIAPRPLRLDGAVDGLNRRVKDDVDRDLPAAWVLRQLSS